MSSNDDLVAEDVNSNETSYVDEEEDEKEPATATATVKTLEELQKESPEARKKRMEAEAAPLIALAHILRQKKNTASGKRKKRTKRLQQLIDYLIFSYRI